MNFINLNNIIEKTLNDPKNDFTELVNMSKNGLNFGSGRIEDNYAKITERFFYDHLSKEQILINEKRYYYKFVVCHKIIINHNPHLLNNRSYSDRTEFERCLYLLYSGTNEGLFRCHEDYLEIAFEMLNFNKNFIDEISILQCINAIQFVIPEKQYKQNNILNMLFNDFGISKVLNEFMDLNELINAKKIKVSDTFIFKKTDNTKFLRHDTLDTTEINKLLDSKWCSTIIKNIMNCYDHELALTLKSILNKKYDIEYIKSTSILYEIVNYYNIFSSCIGYFLDNFFKICRKDILNKFLKYDWFVYLIKTKSNVPQDDKVFINILQNKKYRECLVENKFIIFELIRRRRTKVIKYLWRFEQKKIKTIKNNNGQNVLEYAKTCKGLMHNIIKIFSCLEKK